MASSTMNISTSMISKNVIMAFILRWKK